MEQMILAMAWETWILSLKTNSVKCAKEKNRQAQRRFRERQKCLIQALKDRTDGLQKQVCFLVLWWGECKCVGVILMRQLREKNQATRGTSAVNLSSDLLKLVGSPTCCRTCISDHDIEAEVLMRQHCRWMIRGVRLKHWRRRIRF